MSSFKLFASGADTSLRYGRMGPGKSFLSRKERKPLAFSLYRNSARVLRRLGLALLLSGCGLLSSGSPPNPPTGQTGEPLGTGPGIPGRSLGASGADTPTNTSVPGVSPLPQETLLPGQVATPGVGPAQPRVECTFRMGCIGGGANGASFSGLCLNRNINPTIQSVGDGGPVFPQCERVAQIFADALPTGKHTTTLEGGATLRAFCDGTGFELRNGGYTLIMTVPQATCLELRDRINILKL